MSRSARAESRAAHQSFTPRGASPPIGIPSLDSARDERFGFRLLFRSWLFAALTLTSCIDFDAQYASCIDAGRCTDAMDAGSTTDAGTDAGTTTDAGAPDSGTDAGATDAGATDAGFDAGLDAGFDAGLDAGFDAGVDAGTDAGPSIDAGTWVDISPRMADGGRFGSSNPFGPDVTTGQTSLTIAYRQFGETPAGETARHFSVRRFDGGWSLDPTASDRMSNLAFAQGVPFPAVRSFDSPFDRALIVETDATLAFAPDSYGGGAGKITNIHFTSTVAPVALDFARTGSALAARGTEAWVAMRRCTEGPTAVTLVVSTVASPSVTTVGAGTAGVAASCLALQNDKAFNLGIGPPTLAVNPNNGLKFLAFANGALGPDTALLEVHTSGMSMSTWNAVGSAQGLTPDPLPVESVMALAPLGTSGALLAFEDLAPQAAPRRRVRVFRLNANTFSDPGSSGSNTPFVHRVDTGTDVYVWDAIKSLALLELGGRIWLVVSVVSVTDEPIFVLSLAPTESAWRLHPGPFPSGQLNPDGCSTSRARLSSWQGLPVVVWAQQCGTGTHADLVVKQLQ